MDHGYLLIPWEHWPAWTKERRDRVKRSTRKQPRKANWTRSVDRLGKWKRSVRWLMASISRLLHTCARAFESRALVLPVLFCPNSVSTCKFSKQYARNFCAQSAAISLVFLDKKTIDYELSDEHSSSRNDDCRWLFPWQLHTFTMCPRRRERETRRWSWVLKRSCPDLLLFWARCPVLFVFLRNAQSCLCQILNKR
jgi:hypothetical protein